MQLPEFLSIDDGGFIYVTGRRVGLHHVLRAYHEGLSTEEIAAEYPSVQIAVVYKIIAYYLEHREEVDQYVAEQDRIVAEHIASSRPSPTIEELRTRLAAQHLHRGTSHNVAG